ncbi:MULTISPECIES: hypothetical protein [unclassified Pseudonocardia]|uniref:hypothetical protein n=1 Tax=unclassified Pseudonocardia TaxID=2619320 RepID=UPI0001FFE4F8|nr:hypothetical protein [Pseudonocardia sp. Ae707_Ps1]OLM15899.1 hypothetical protein Ae707Ps1_0157c [Pseudonocardia sp. Ae707_Ps1]
MADEAGDDTSRSPGRSDEPAVRDGMVQLGRLGPGPSFLAAARGASLGTFFPRDHFLGHDSALFANQIGASLAEAIRPKILNMLPTTASVLGLQHQSVMNNFSASLLGRFPAWDAGFSMFEPTDLVPSLRLGPLLDGLRPEMTGLSLLTDSVIEQFRVGLVGEPWRDLLRMGQRAAWWAVYRAYEAMERGDTRALEQFLRDWLDVRPSQKAVEALHEALLIVDLAAVPQEDGWELIDLVKVQFRDSAREWNRALRGDVGRQIGQGRWVHPLPEYETTVRVPGMPDLALEDDRVVDWVESGTLTGPAAALLAGLSREDQAVAMVKASHGCGWSAAAEVCGRPRRDGDAIAQRLRRLRKRTGAVPGYGDTSSPTSGFTSTDSGLMVPHQLREELRPW